MSSEDPLGAANPATGLFESMEALGRAWSLFGVPTGFTPTMDPDEIDKRIADLRIVEQWLNMNLVMLRNGIRTLEMQRGTLAAFKSMGEGTRSPPAGNDAAPPEATTVPDPMLWWQTLQQQFLQVANMAAQTPPPSWPMGSMPAAAPSPAAAARKRPRAARPEGDNGDTAGRRARAPRGSKPGSR